jgi:hypothetical protein
MSKNIQRLKQSRFWDFLRKSKVARRVISIPYIRRLYLETTGAEYLGIPKNISVEDFFLELNKNDIEYVVLRWFEGLPSISNIGDIDILVSEKHYKKIFGKLTGSPLNSSIQVDLYSDTGYEWRSSGKVPYYPPSVATKIIHQSVKTRYQIKIPSKRNYFYSLAYHATYHKGFNSGLHSKFGNPKAISNGNNKYYLALSKLATEIGINEKFDTYTLEELDDFLAIEGWRPELDTFIKLSNSNSWMETLILNNSFGDITPFPAGSVLFFIRESHSHLVDEICLDIKVSGGKVVLTMPLNKEEVDKVTSEVRGGCWPLVEGGKASHIVIARFCSVISKDLLKFTGGLKHAFRKKFYNKGSNGGFSVVHSSDSELLAAHHIALIAPDKFKDINILLLKVCNNP